MERLLCCLLGFPEKDAQVLRSLTRLFRPSLSADWAFEVGVSEDCDLLVCDLDDPGGRHAWNSPAPPGLLRAAASANAVDNAGALLLRKPLRGHGPSGIVQVLNAAAASKHPEIAPRRRRPRNRPATASAPKEPPPAPSAFFKPEIRAPARSPPPPPPPAAEEPAPGEAPPDLSEWDRDGAEMRRNRVGSDRPRPSTITPARQSRPRPRAPPPGPTRPTPPPRRSGQASAPVPAPEPTPVAQPAWASEAPHGAEPAQDDADIKDILRRMRFATVGTPSEAPTMLAALRGIRGSDKAAAVLEAPGLTPLCVMPQARAWFSAGTAAEVFGWLGEGNRPVRVLPFGSTEEARDAAGAKDEPPRPLEQLMWIACLRTPPERLAPYESELFRLKRWPDLGNLPHEPHHMHWCGILTRQKAPLHALAKNGGVSARADGLLPRCLRRARHPGPHRGHRGRDRGGRAARRFQEGPRADLAVQEHPRPVEDLPLVKDIKLIVTGSMGAGKTTVVSTISDIPPIRTDVPISSDKARGDKTTTTVALDYGSLTLDKERRLLIFGTPGQRRYDFMCKILARGALGVVILIDHACEDPVDDLRYYLDLFRDTIEDSTAVVGVTHTDEKPDAPLQPYYDLLAERDMPLPVFSIDARRHDHIIMMLEALLATTR